MKTGASLAPLQLRHDAGDLLDMQSVMASEFRSLKAQSAGLVFITLSMFLCVTNLRAAAIRALPRDQRAGQRRRRMTSVQFAIVRLRDPSSGAMARIVGSSSSIILRMVFPHVSAHERRWAYVICRPLVGVRPRPQIDQSGRP